MASSRRMITVAASIMAIVAAAAVLYWLFAIVPEGRARSAEFQRLLEQARDLRDLQHDSSGAAATLSKAMEIRPSDPEAALLMGQIEIDLKRYDRAIERLESLVGGSTEVAGAASGLRAELLIGRAYVARYRDTVQRKDFDRARARLVRVLRSASDREMQADAAGSLFWLYLWMAAKDPRQTERAKEYYDKYMELAPDAPMAETIKKAYEVFTRKGG